MNEVSIVVLLLMTPIAQDTEYDILDTGWFNAQDLRIGWEMTVSKPLISQDDSRPQRPERRGPLSPTINRLTPSTLTKDCYFTLKEAILRLDLLPGTPLVETQVAGQLGISKSPVREALLRLTGEGLVVAEPGKSCVVAGITISQIREWYQLRAILEPASLAQVGREISEEVITRLRKVNAEALDAYRRDDAVAFVSGGDAFHLLLIEQNPNRTLTAIVNNLFEQIRRVRIALYSLDRYGKRPGLATSGLERHEHIIEMLAKGELARAEQLLKADIETFLDHVDTPDIRPVLNQLAVGRGSEL